MKKMTSLIFMMICCYFLTFIPHLVSAQQNLQLTSQVDRLIGVWQGKLSFPGAELRIVFHLNKSETGELTTALDSPDQGAFNIATSRTSIVQDTLVIEVAMIRGLFKGKIAADFNSISGNWQQSGISIPLELTRTDTAPKLNRPQEPTRPYPYLEEEVTVHNEAYGVDLAGTFTRPQSKGRFPAAILITGSGPQDRDEAIFGHRPFLVLADYLTRRGIAVLRMDDRGVGKSTGDFSKATTEDFAADVLVAVNYLKTRDDVDPKKIGLIGHSEGGIVAPMVAARSKDVAFIVLMAGTGLTGEQILYQQAELIARANGANDSIIAKNRHSQEQIFAVLKHESDDSNAIRKLRPILKQSIELLSDTERKAISDPEIYINAQIRQLTSPWFRLFLTYDPKTALSKVKCPVLAINGELDLQVPARENLKAIEAALKAGGNNQVTIRSLPQLNHLFQTAKTGSPNEYAVIEETIAPSALQLIGDWIMKQTTN
ncbi:MAG: alpha/beta fold hydrolase [candidate division KSB1 bacterium]|nr:alpha/beta fold hydrolase [candidate division KSB1 bacterium]MDZ7334102.1 alpha/beta fold hydrolase [candidate division KSB1 bacterium]MDZ7356309.1 alpha/beta fold hydrolase [candidate division KSB1 bacterium]MDZ7401933.1 alpha/beta fold hydrolase [candidate division KSB1 bacterium]